MTIRITKCPTCGSRRIKKIRRNWKGSYRGRIYVVPALELYDCPDCHEEIFDRDAMRKIEAYSPAYAKPRAASG